ncbi:M14 family metallopeptidase [Kaarinaea lacus]
MLNIIDHIPEGFVDCAAEDLHQLLPGPTLIHLQGRRREPLFVSVLLHGNEPTGLKAIQALLKKNAGQTLPRALSVFIGNISAAKEGRRHLDDQPDYNRIWPCADNDDAVENTPEHSMMQEIVDIMREKNIFASIDVHNNTGLNPHYGCINKLETAFFHLATQFSRTVVYFIRPRGVQSMAFAEICPAVTVECGKPDHNYGAAHAMEFIESCLQLSSLPQHPVAPHDIDLFHTVATVSVPDHLSIGFGNIDTNLQFIEDLDHLNFRELQPGTRLGEFNVSEDSPPLNVTDENGEEVTSLYFSFDNNELCIKRPVMPSMFTLNTEIIHQDCLGYLMERMDNKHL